MDTTVIWPPRAHQTPNSAPTDYHVENSPVLPDIDTRVAVIGGGIAGIWTALKLAAKGIPTVLVTYKAKDRGGAQGSTSKSVGAINTSPVGDSDFAKRLDELTQGQANTSIGKLLSERLAMEIESLRQYSELEEINLGVRLAKGDSRRLLERLYREFERQGGTILYGWVTRIVADAGDCRGLQYQCERGIGKLRSQFIVIASGGYAGLFDGSVQTASYGTVLGQFMQSGGGAANLEFLFKHGYGKPDIGQLTPTEELRGADILDQDGGHVTWLERELFNGNGTRNHHRALRFWRDNKDKRFYVSLRHRTLYDRVQSVNELLSESDGANRIAFRPLRDRLSRLLQDISPAARGTLRRQFVQRLREQRPINYEAYCKLRGYRQAVDTDQRPSPIRQIAYFTMGGIAHHNFETNLPNVYVTGEAMHDFGANRVGGLPWGLYLVAGSVIAEQIAERVDRAIGAQAADFELVRDKAQFDKTILQQLRALLHKNQEESFRPNQAKRAINWLRFTRRRLLRNGEKLNDAISWLVVAEAIFKASLARQESRGCFMRDDFVDQNDELRDFHTYCYYDDAADDVVCQLISKSNFERFFAGQSQQERCCA